MTHCLACPEDILFRIFEFVYYEPHGWVGWPTLAALARTCRKFHNPALDILWSNLPTLAPLFYCLPSEATVRTRREIQLSPRYSPTPEDWKACLKYTPRIKRLGCELLGVNFPDFDVTAPQEALDILQNHISLPNLRDLQWSSSNLGDYHFRTGPLRTLMVDCFEFEEIRDVVEPLSAESPLLQNLSIWMPVHFLSQNPELSFLLQSIICRHQLLRQLSCSTTLLPQAVLRLLSASKIEVLSVRNTAEDLIQSLPSTELGFSALRRLTIFATHLKYCSELLERINSQSLTSLEIEQLHLPDSLSIEKLLQTLERQCSHTLFVSVQLRQEDFASPPEKKYRAPEYGLALSTIRPLFSFKNLETLKIELYCPYRLVTSDIVLMAQKWPRMREFGLGFDHEGFGCASRISVTCLLSIAKHWSDLEELCISLKCDTKEMSRVRRHGGGYSCPKLVDLAVGNSKVDPRSYRPLAAFLFDIFPNIEPPIRHNEDYCKTWSDIQTLVERFVSAREQEREGK